MLEHSVVINLVQELVQFYLKILIVQEMRQTSSIVQLILTSVTAVMMKMLA